MSLSVDEARIAASLEKWAAAYDKRWLQRPFGLDKVRAAVLRKVAQAIREGKHR